MLSIDISTQPTQEDNKSKHSVLLSSPQHSLMSRFSDDMNEILAPSMDDDDDVENGDFSYHPSTFLNTLSPVHTNSFPISINNTFSADESILRRVEKEISAARGESEKNNLRNIILKSTISNDDMEQILQTLTSSDKYEEENRNPPVVMERSDCSVHDNKQRIEAASPSSFDHVMDMIDSEFRDSNDENPMKETFTGKKAICIHREVREEEEQPECYSSNCDKGDTPSKRGIMDGFVELLSQGLIGVNLGEKEEESGREALEEDLSKQMHDLATALNGGDFTSEHAVGAVWETEDTESDGSSVMTAHSHHDNEASDYSDEEQAVAKWAQLLAESSPGGDDASITVTTTEADEATVTTLQVADSMTVPPKLKDALNDEDDLATTMATLPIEVKLEAHDPISSSTFPGVAEDEADKHATPTTLPVDAKVDADDPIPPTTLLAEARDETDKHVTTTTLPVEVELEADDLVATIIPQVVEAEPEVNNVAAATNLTVHTELAAAVDATTTKLATVESFKNEAKSIPQEKAIDEKLSTTVSTKPPLAPSPRLHQGLGSPSSTTRSLREMRKLFAQQEVKHTEKDPTEQPPDGHDEQSLLKSSRKLRFRKSFPVLKPARGPRPNDKIIQSHSHGIPTRPTFWIKPKAELKQLIVAAMGTSLQRRSNACGALKVLSLSKKNQMSLARTDTFLTALVFAISQEIADTDSEISIAARIRALTCLRNVCRPKENRVHAFTQPGLIECLINVINTDNGESRVLACSTLVLLAKSTECREGLGAMTGLVDCLSRVVGRIVASSDNDEEEEDGAGDNNDDSFTESDSDTSSDSSSESSTDSSADSSRSSGESEGDRGNESSSETDEEDYSEIESAVTDTDLEKLHQEARLNACAVLVHLSRSCVISHALAKNKTLVRTCVKVTMEIVNPVHSKCLEILRNLTLLPGNCSLLSRSDGVITSFTSGANSQYPENRIAALRGLQNLSGDAASKSILASAHVLHLLTACAIRSNPDEKEAAVAALYNISTEPSTVVAVTNTRNVIATLVHIAHHTETASHVRLLACEALATTSLWLQTLAGTGKCPESVPNVLLPSHKTYGWERWN